MLRSLLRTCVFAFAILTANQIGAQTHSENREIAIEGAWTPATDGVELPGAAYFTNRNHGPKAAKMIEVRAKYQSIIAPGASLTLAPSGYRVALLDINVPLQVGHHFPLNQIFCDGQEMMIEVPVLEADAVGSVAPASVPGR